MNFFLGFFPIPPITFLMVRPLLHLGLQRHLPHRAIPGCVMIVAYRCFRSCSLIALSPRVHLKSILLALLPHYVLAIHLLGKLHVLHTLNVWVLMRGVYVTKSRYSCVYVQLLSSNAYFITFGHSAK